MRKRTDSPTTTEWARYKEYVEVAEILQGDELNKLCQGYLREISDDEYMQRQYAHMDEGDADG